MRPTKLQNYMDLAKTIAQRSHDSETKVGAVLVNNKTGAILAASYNGFVRGADDTALPTTRPDKYPYMMHAEQNIIANCARHGISMEDCILYTTMSPCVQCARMIWQAGISIIYFKDIYNDFKKSIDMGDLTITIKKIGSFYMMNIQSKT